MESSPVIESNPIIILDDDQDDLDLIREAAESLGITRPIRYFSTGDELVAFLEHSELSPYLIISDVNLPGADGFAVRQRITEHATLRYKSVPFIFWSTSASERQIQHAYDLPAQGFFVKAQNFTELCDTFQTILHYWAKSLHPKKVS
ncbi:MAG: response regulator [Chitinophagaceae bacterium]|nr:MAG: response regulator [Chitinophagaceae bacterium]